jgi:hypothetical protein
VPSKEFPIRSRNPSPRIDGRAGYHHDGDTESEQHAHVFKKTVADILGSVFGN